MLIKHKILLMQKICILGIFHNVSYCSPWRPSLLENRAKVRVTIYNNYCISNIFCLYLIWCIRDKGYSHIIAVSSTVIFIIIALPAIYWDWNYNCLMAAEFMLVEQPRTPAASYSKSPTGWPFCSPNRNLSLGTSFLGQQILIHQSKFPSP